MEAVRGNLKMLEEAAIGSEEEQQPAAGVMFPPERGHVKANAFFSLHPLYSWAHRSSVSTGVFCDVALHVVVVMKSKAAGSLCLSYPTPCCQHTLAHTQ